MPDPGDVGGGEGRGEEGGVVLSLGDDEGIAGDVFIDDEPGGAGAADAEAFALADGVVGDALVLTEGLAVDGLDGAGVVPDVPADKVGKFPLTDEADACAVALGGCGEVVLGGEGADGALFEVADGEEGAAQGLGLDGVEEVALVFAGVKAAEELGSVVDDGCLAIVAGGDVVGTHGECFIEEGFEFDLTVAEDVGIGGEACL